MFEYIVSEININGEVLVGNEFVDINKLGQAGWELVTVQGITNSWGSRHLAFFKRYKDSVLGKEEFL